MNRAGQTAAGVGSGVLVVWAWNAAVPGVPMPAEVGAVVGALLQPALDVAGAVRDFLVRRLGAGDAGYGDDAA